MDQAYLLDSDEQFLVPGWRLDSSWILCTLSAGTAVLCAVGLGMSAYFLPPEHDYELLQDPVTARYKARRRKDREPSA
jgi:hypothetical protein